MRKMRLAMAVALLSIYGTSPTFAQATGPTPHIAEQGADFYRFRVGAVTITALSDGTVPLDRCHAAEHYSGEDGCAS